MRDEEKERKHCVAEREFVFRHKNKQKTRTIVGTASSTHADESANDDGTETTQQNESNQSSERTTLRDKNAFVRTDFVFRRIRGTTSKSAPKS